MEKLRFPISLPTSKNDFQLAQVFSAEQIAQRRAIDLEIVDAVQQSTEILKAIQVPVGARHPLLRLSIAIANIRHRPGGHCPEAHDLALISLSGHQHLVQNQESPLLPDPWSYLSPVPHSYMYLTAVGNA
jgi:hypothetical protein